MGQKDSLRQEHISMLMIEERRPAIRTLRRWAISVLQEAGAIRERAFDIARQDPPTGVSPGRRRRDHRGAGPHRRYLSRMPLRRL